MAISPEPTHPYKPEPHADLPCLAQHSTHIPATIMTTPSNRRIFLDDLARRWRQDTDRIVELASNGVLPLWISFTEVYVQKNQKKTAGSAKRRKTPARERHEQIEVRPLPEMLAQILGRCDRMLITAELPGFDAEGNSVSITNSVGEEWGETSMIGLKPTLLFALLDDVIKYEKKNSIIPATVQVEHQEMTARAASNQTDLCSIQPGMPPELRAAIACWQALCAQQGADPAPVRKTEVLAWLHRHHSELTKAAMERIALVISFAKSGCR